MKNRNIQWVFYLCLGEINIHNVDVNTATDQRNQNIPKY